MKIALIINMVWSILIATGFALLMAIGYSQARGVLFAIAIVYIVISIFSLRSIRWAILISIFVSMIVMARWLPMVIINFWMFITGHELYIESPGTILVVGIYAIVFAFPASLLCGLYLRNYRSVISLFKKSNVPKI